MKVDFHTHCFPDNLYQKAITHISNTSKVYPYFDGSVGGLLRSMSQAGVDKSVVANIATNAKQNINVNNFAIDCLKYEQLCPFGSIHPDFTEYKAEIDRLHNNGIKGLKFHPDYQNYNIDDIKMMAVYEYALSLGMVLLFHTGEDRSFADNGSSCPKRVKNLVKAFNTERIVAAHMGGEGYREEMEKELLGEKISFDTSFGFTLMNLDMIRRILKNHNTDYIMFGTDTPWADQSDDLIQYLNMDIPKDILTKILGGNAQRLLNL